MVQFTLEQECFQQAVQIVQGVVEKKHTIPVLSNILCVVNETGDAISFTSTDLEIGIQTTIPILQGTPGSITLPAQTLVEIVRELPHESVIVTGEDNHWVRIECAGFTSRLAGLPRTDFPEVPVFSGGPLELDSVMLERALRQTTFAISTDPSRYGLTGGYFSFTETGCQIVATDGHRLSLFASHGTVSEKGVIIPRKALTEVKKLCTLTPMIGVAFEKNQVAFAVGDTTLTARLIDAQFPAYDQVIPESPTMTTTFNTAVLSQAVRRVMLLGGASQLIAFAFAEHAVTVSGRDVTGEASERIACPWEYDPVTIGFNGRYVLDVLQVCEGESMTLGITDPLQPGLWYDDHGQAQHVIMPMHVQGV